MRILTFDIESVSFSKLDGKRRNLLVGCMHAHNELSFLNRLLLFSMNDFADGELHDHAKNGQMHCVMQLLAGKLFAAWEMLIDRALPENPPLSPEHERALIWLQDYFGSAKAGWKSRAIKIVRDKTAFHYEGIDLGRALKHMPLSERSIHLARHPVNILYNLGSAAVFYALFEEVCRKAGKRDLPFDEMVKAGSRMLIEDLKDANYNLALLLYGLIAGIFAEMPGSPLDANPIQTDCESAPTPGKIVLPAWLRMEGYDE